jgi:hypothetical protein
MIWTTPVPFAFKMGDANNDYSAGLLSHQIEQPLRLVHSPRVKSGNFTGALP